MAQYGNMSENIKVGFQHCVPLYLYLWWILIAIATHLYIVYKSVYFNKNFHKKTLWVGLCYFQVPVPIILFGSSYIMVDKVLHSLFSCFTTKYL